ncbi:MAG: GTP cyclohydrolase I FolE [Oligoflexales bacterium]|nr:GTP cyclohydrolase I FolE [Oligoflexales bacterium]
MLDIANRKEHQDHIRKLILSWGEDPERDGLLKTPERFLKSMSYLTSGYDADVGEVVNGALFDVAYDDMVVVRDIEFYSLCEHHMLPFYGKCHLGYIPTNKVIGLSKIPRIVDIFARRLQVQERLTNEVAQAFSDYMKPKGVGVVIEANHLCMMMRGVEKQGSMTISSSMQGCFRNLETKEEFMSHVRSARL